jgi:hypothetical protein
VGLLKQHLFGIAADEATVGRRGFRVTEEAVCDRLDRIGATFLRGYHAALQDDDPGTLASRLNDVDSELRGFAFEGAAMGLSLLDHLTPWRRTRWDSFVRGVGAPHVYMVHVGRGWTIARLPWLRSRLDHALARLDPLLRWLAIDGYGFHEGYFHGQRRVRDRTVPGRLDGYARRVFDQGLGRSLWFVEGTDAHRIVATIRTFPQSRRSDLWSGVGLACSYAGGADETGLHALRTAAEDCQPQLAQGAAFAAAARLHAGNSAPHTTLACQVLASVSSDVAAQVVDEARENLRSDGPEPSYEVWRRRIQLRLSGISVTAT